MASPGRKDDAEPRVLITGAGGFVGRHLAAALQQRHPDWRLDLPGGPGEAGGLDVSDPDAVSDRIERGRPDMVVHLAAVAAVTTSLRDPRLAWRINLDGTLNVVLAMQQHVADAHLLFVSSAEVYGQSLVGAEPVDEGALLQPVNPYAASKAAGDILVRQAAAAGLAATVCRPFNHIGPGQSDAFLVPNFAGQIARIEAGLQAPVIEVGSLDEERDFLDVEDVVHAYRLLMERRSDPAARGVFNIASGQAIRIGDILERLLSRSRVKIEVRVDPDRLRPTSIRTVVGDASRLRSLGWAPRRSIDDSLGAVLEDCRRASARG